MIGDPDTWTTIATKADLTDEVKDIIESNVEGWPDDSAADHLDRAEGMYLDDGSRIDFGGSFDAEGYKAALAYARKMKRDLS